MLKQIFIGRHNILGGHRPPVVSCNSCGQRLTGTDAWWIPSICPDCKRKENDTETDTNNKT